MLNREEQPAKKGYFFGQGIKDLSTAIKNSWLKNAQTVKGYYTKYSIHGLMSFEGIFNFFCAMSVMTFGMIFLALISSVILTIFLLMYISIYTILILVWSFDRAYLLRKKIFTACHECKNRFIIPIYLCPKCNEKHTNLTPGVYGMLHRTCNCGEKLPVTFFNGRKELQAICPDCLQESKYTILNERESRPLCIPVVGGRSVGKTAYITAFSHKFVEEIAPNNKLDIKFYNENKKRIYNEIATDYKSGSTRMTARPLDISKASSISFSFFVKHPSLRPERLLHIYDIAGEVFTDNNENEVQKQYEYCQGIIFIIDPFSISDVLVRYEDSLTPEDKAGIGRADINGIIDVFINKLREVTGLSDRKMSKVPLAVLIGKIDSAGLSEEFSKSKMSALSKAFPGINESDAIDYLCRQFLKKHGMEGFLNAITIKFANHRFFAISAIGHTRDEGQYEPIGVIEPIEWICSVADKQFHSLWGSHSFSKQTIQER